MKIKNLHKRGYQELIRTQRAISHLMVFTTLFAIIAILIVLGVAIWLIVYLFF